MGGATDTQLGLGSRLGVERSVPALVVKVGDYPIHHGGLGVMRSLGRLGIPVYALTDRRLTPAAWSRYLTGTFDWSAADPRQPDQLVDRLRSIATELGRPALGLATDDEAAILLAEHASQLCDRFLLPGVAAGLPRELNSKQGLFDWCTTLGIPTPRTAFPSSASELAGLGRELGYPLIAKNVTALGKRTSDYVVGTVLVADEAELMHRFAGRADLTGLLLQEYLPHDQGEDWCAHFYCAADSTCLVNISCRKVRSWPPGQGWTAYASTEDNPAVTELVATVCAQVGWQGIACVDVRFDHRDRTYKLLDFNPRMGAQFRSAETEAGIDVVRAAHLHLTGRAVPSSPANTRRRMVIETNDCKARLAYRWQGLTTPVVQRNGMQTSYGWWASDDPVPCLLMLVRGAMRTLAKPWRILRRRISRQTGGRGYRAADQATGRNP
jgi:predicted ATP-grasp superfamily ATP-dependent carboligase